MRIDLHTHSLASDGTDSPGDLVRAAQTAGLDVVAITDHDATAGWEEAAAAAEHAGISLVRGLEISTKHAGRSVHLLAYLPDPTYAPLADALHTIIEGRRERTPAIVAALREHGIDITEDDVAREADSSLAAGRPHVADALTRLGVVAHRTQAFTDLLNPGRPGYVNRDAADLTSMLALVRAAGGVSVIAHPWGRSGRAALDGPALESLRGLGLVGIEVDHQDHDPATRATLRGLAADLDLVTTGSSDYHGLGKVDHDLGVNTTGAEQFERLVALAAESARASGRSAPEVLWGRSAGGH